MSQQLNEDNSRALATVINNMTGLFASSTSQQVKGVINSPEFAQAIQRAGGSLIADPQFQKNMRSIFSSVMSDLITTQEIKNIVIDIIKKAIENLVSSEIVKSVLTDISITIIDGFTNHMSQQSREVKSFMGDEISKGIKNAIEDGLPLFEEAMTSSVKGALSNFKPKIHFDATAVMDLDS